MLANSAPTGFRTFGSVLADGDTCYYTIVGGAEWEVGIGTYATSGTTLARTRVLSSSNSGSAVNLSAGTKDIFISMPASQFNWLLSDIRKPVDGDFSWTNQGTAGVRVTSNGIYLYDNTPAAAGTYQVRMRRKAAPSTPYTISASFLVAAEFKSTSTSFFYFGLCWRQSSDGKAIVFGYNQGNAATYLSCQKLTTSLGYSSSYYDESEWGGWNGLVHLRIADDGTNRSTWLSPDGVNWFQQGANVSRTDYLTADQVGFFISPSGQQCNITLVNWKEE